MKRFTPLALILPSFALAATLNFSWDNATTNTDGSSIPSSGAGSLVATHIEYGICNPGKTDIAQVQGTVTVAGALQAGQSPDLPPGEWCAHARHENTFGQFSAWSAVASKSVPAPIPNAPSNFSFGS